MNDLCLNFLVKGFRGKIVKQCEFLMLSSGFRLDAVNSFENLKMLLIIYKILICFIF